MIKCMDTYVWQRILEARTALARFIQEIANLYRTRTLHKAAWSIDEVKQAIGKLPPGSDRAKSLKTHLKLVASGRAGDEATFISVSPRNKGEPISSDTSFLNMIKGVGVSVWSWMLYTQYVAEVLESGETDEKLLIPWTGILYTALGKAAYYVNGLLVGDEEYLFATM